MGEMGPGSLSGFTVPSESRRTEPWEPGSREGNRLVVAATGRRGQDSEPEALVYGTAAGGNGRLPTIGRTVCGKSARTGLWGVPAGNRRHYPEAPLRGWRHDSVPKTDLPLDRCAPKRTVD